MGFPLKKQCQLALMLSSAFLGGCGGGGGSTGPSAQLKPPAPNGGNAGSVDPVVSGKPTIAQGTSEASTQGNAFIVVIPDISKLTPAQQSKGSGSTATVAPVVRTGAFGDADGVQVENKSTSVSLSGGGVSPLSSRALNTCVMGYCSQQSPNEDHYFDSKISDIDERRFNKDRQTLILHRDAAGSPLQYSNYGEYSAVLGVAEREYDAAGWEIGSYRLPGNSVTAAYFHQGTATSSQDMANLKASNVVASYQGNLEGVRYNNGANISGSNGILAAQTAPSIRGDVALKANFGAGTLSGNVYNINSVGDTYAPSKPETYGLRLDGSINGGTYRGTSAFTNASDRPGQGAVGPVRGELLGAFYGPSAAETAGVARIEGVAPGSTATQTLIGSFGAKKQ